LAELLLEISQIPVVNQESQNGKYFHNQLWHPRSISALILQLLSYFVYLILHTHLSGLSQLQDFFKNPHFEFILSPNGSIATMATMLVADMASHVANNPPALAGRTMVLPSTDQQRHLILHVMAKLWGILSLREFQVKAVAQLVFHPKICLFLI
jgi:hypothetical protein